MQSQKLSCMYQKETIILHCIPWTFEQLVGTILVMLTSRYQLMVSSINGFTLVEGKAREKIVVSYVKEACLINIFKTK